MPRLCSGLFVVLMFLCGVLLGGLSDHWWMNRSARAKGSWDETRAHILEQVKGELSLTAEQGRQMELILDSSMKDFDDLHHRAHELRLETRDKIRKILTDPQKQKFEATMAKLQRAMGSQ